MNDYELDLATIDFIVSDFNLNILDKNLYLDLCIAERIDMLGKQYDAQLDKIMTFIILRYNFDDLPITYITKMTKSLTKVANAINKGFLSMIGDK